MSLVNGHLVEFMLCALNSRIGGPSLLSDEDDAMVAYRSFVEIRGTQFSSVAHKLIILVWRGDLLLLVGLIWII